MCRTATEVERQHIKIDNWANSIHWWFGWKLRKKLVRRPQDRIVWSNYFQDDEWTLKLFIFILSGNGSSISFTFFTLKEKFDICVMSVR